MNARTVAMMGLALAAVGLLVPGFHHVRCGAMVSMGASGESTLVDSGCQETFPSAIVPFASVLGLAGVSLALFAAFRLASAAEGERAARVVLGLAAMSLLVPTLPPLATWTWVGFDLAIQSGTGCSSMSAHKIPLWIQHTTCVTRLDLLATPLCALAGILAAIGARRSTSPHMPIAALALVGIAFAAFIASVALGEASLAVQWLVPLLGGVLLAGALGLVTRATSTAQSA